MIARISSSSKAPSTVGMSTVMYSFTNDFLCRVISGKFKREEGRKKVLTELVHENSTLLNQFCVGDYFPWLCWVDRFMGFLERAKKNHKRWDELLDEPYGEEEVEEKKEVEEKEEVEEEEEARCSAIWGGGGGGEEGGGVEEEVHSAGGDHG
ncbi:hypothetical protein Cni_G25977 [Canna indica]|uniref:Cytochrome P450 n=1 Tax=Canna indica TaxID=4628 RepID=A0AAQ3QPV5_9LILI|nr:hypothetical protein Cni_G25977 [Canna indica]